MQVAPAAGPNAFYGRGRCLALTAEASLSVGAGVLVLAANQAPVKARVETVRQSTEEPECFRQFRGEPPSRFARLDLSDAWQSALTFALPVGPNDVILGGPPVRLSASEAGRLARLVSASLAPPWRSQDVLKHAFRYGPSNGRAAIELYLGRPTLNPAGVSPPIQAIAIRRFFLVADKVLASEEYERASGREERVDTEAPELTFNNWSTSETEQTVAFASNDDGRSWNRLSTNGGFEGIWWIIQALRPGLPRTFEQFLYTPH